MFRYKLKKYQILGKHQYLLQQEKSRVDQEVGRLRAALADLQASLASATSDKERYFQEKMDLHQRIQQLSHERDSLLKVKEK